MPDTFLEAGSREEHDKTEKLVPSEFIWGKIDNAGKRGELEGSSWFGKKRFSGRSGSLSLVTGKELMKWGRLRKGGDDVVGTLEFLISVSVR